MTIAPSESVRRSFMVEYDPCMFTATLNMDSAGTWLVIYASTILDWTDPQFHPVLTRLARFCSRMVTRSTIPDENMMFLEANMYEMELFEQCPGSGTDHSCCRIDNQTPRFKEGALLVR